MGARAHAHPDEPAGRDRSTISVSVFGARPEDLERYADAGVDRCLLWLPPAGRDEILPRLDRYTSLLG